MPNSKLEEFLDSLSEADRNDVLAELSDSVAAAAHEMLGAGKVQLDAEEQPAPEIIDETQWITGEYLSAACKMISEQFTRLHFKEWPANKEEFHDRVTRMFRQHCPIAYSYYFTNSQGQNIIPTGTVDIVLEYVHASPEGKDFMGGKHSGIILP